MIDNEGLLNSDGNEKKRNSSQSAEDSENE